MTSPRALSSASSPLVAVARRAPTTRRVPLRTSCAGPARAPSRRRSSRQRRTSTRTWADQSQQNNLCSVQAAPEPDFGAGKRFELSKAASVEQESACEPSFSRLAFDPDRGLDGRRRCLLDLGTENRDPSLQVALDRLDRALAARCQREGSVQIDGRTGYVDGEPAVANSVSAGRAPVLGLGNGQSVADHASDDGWEVIWSHVAGADDEG